ncbi:gamma subclass chorismate mutase AroQ [Nocardia sp. NPDC003482]
MRAYGWMLVGALIFGASAGAGVPASPAHAEPVAERPLDRLVELTLERLETADVVAAAKWVAARGGDPGIDDPAREAEVYDAMARAGAGLGLDAERVRQVFGGQIEANKLVQRGLVTRWRVDPAAAPTAAPELSAVRPVIDRVNGELLAQLAEHRADLAGPGCVERLSTSVFPALSGGRADALHQAALVRASAALCAPM